MFNFLFRFRRKRFFVKAIEGRDRVCSQKVYISSSNAQEAIRNLSLQQAPWKEVNQKEFDRWKVTPNH